MRAARSLSRFHLHSHSNAEDAAAALESRPAAAAVDDETLFALLRAAREAGMQLSRGEASDMLTTQAVPPALQGTLLRVFFTALLRTQML